MILATEEMTQQIKQMDVGKGIYSDSAPVCMLWAIFEHRSVGEVWRLDNLMLETNRVGYIIKQKQSCSLNKMDQHPKW